MKKLLIFLITLLFIPSVHALDVEDVPIVDYVNDYAGILSPEVKTYIKEQSEILYKTDGTQIVVVTVRSLEGNPLEDFTHDLGNHYKIGKDSKGLIIFVSVEDRLARVEVGDNLEGILNDAKAGRFMDAYMIPYLKNNDWDNGIKNVYIALRNEIIEKNNLDITKGEVQTVHYDYEIDDIDDPIFIAAGFALLAAFFFGIIFNGARFNIADIIVSLFLGAPVYVSLYRNISFISFALFASGFAFFLYVILRLSTNSSGYGGHGGSSWSSSSGGHSSGGGFSGGGGHFSGGGASRGF